jgi:hypothetical protein
MSKKITFTTPVGRLSYPHLFKPQPPMAEGDKPKFGCAVIFDAETDISAIEDIVQQVALDHFGEAGMKKIGKRFRSPLREDGEEKGYPEGSVFFNARSTRAPGLVSRYKDPETGKLLPIEDESLLYPGCDVKVNVTAYAFDVSGNRGVALGLNHVLKYADNDRLDGRRNADVAFDGDGMDLDEVDLNEEVTPEDELQSTYL